VAEAEGSNPGYLTGAGFIDPGLAEAWQERVPHLWAKTIDWTNDHLILLAPAAAVIVVQRMDLAFLSPAVFQQLVGAGW
jgi:hypothetical protein